MTDKPLLKTERITREYWQCNMPSHRHRSENAAKKCMEILSGKGRKYESDLLPRNIAATKRILSGETISSVAGELGISAGRLADIACSVLRKVFYSYKDDIIDGDDSIKYPYQIFGSTVTEFRKRQGEIMPWLLRYEQDSR